MINNIIYILDKKISSYEMQECKHYIDMVIGKLGMNSKNIITFIVQEEQEKDFFVNQMNKEITSSIEGIECLNTENKHVSNNLDIEDNYINTVFRMIIQIIKLNNKENKNTILVFDNINEKVRRLSQIVNNIFSVRVFYRHYLNSDIGEIEYALNSYSDLKKYFITLRQVYRQGFILEEMIERSIVDGLKFFIEENHNRYRLTPLGESVYEKIYDDNGFNSEDKYKEVSLYMQNIIESLNSKNYIKKIIIKEKSQWIIPNNIEIIEDSNKWYIQATLNDGQASYILDIFIADKYDLTDICIDLEKRYCKGIKDIKSGLVEFILIRHADDLGEYENRIAGCYDFDITEKGKKQIELLAERFSNEKLKVDCIFSSPLKRARLTAEKISEVLDREVIYYKDLEASNYGYPSGLTKREAIIKYPSPREGYIPCSNIWGKESEIEYCNRVVNAFYNIYYSNIGKRVVIVTHGRAISAIMREVMQLPASKEVWIKCDDTSIHQFIMGNDFVEIIKINDTRHLQNN